MAKTPLGNWGGRVSGSSDIHIAFSEEMLLWIDSPVHEVVRRGEIRYISIPPSFILLFSHYKYFWSNQEQKSRGYETERRGVEREQRLRHPCAAPRPARVHEASYGSCCEREKHDFCRIAKNSSPTIRREILLQALLCCILTSTFFPSDDPHSLLYLQQLQLSYRLAVSTCLSTLCCCGNLQLADRLRLRDEREKRRSAGYLKANILFTGYENYILGGKRAA